MDIFILSLIFILGIPWALFSRKQKPGETEPLIASKWEGYDNWMESMPKLYKLVLVIVTFRILFTFWIIL